MDESCDPANEAIEAALPIDILADPDDRDPDEQQVWTRSVDLVSGRNLGPGDRAVAGWGERAWRTQLGGTAGPRSRDSRHQDPPRALHVWTLAPPAEDSTDGRSLESRLREWHSQARLAMAELLPNAIDAATRSELVHRVLAQPTEYASRQDRALRRLLGAHRVLRWVARRAVLSTVATLQLGHHFEPAASPSWILLARLTRVPRIRLTPDGVSTAVLRSEAAPLCRTAQMMLNPPSHTVSRRHEDGSDRI